MHRHSTLTLLLVVFSVLLLPACDSAPPEDVPAPEGAFTILTIGDSRVEGARPLFESYRYELWKNFVRNERIVNFVGPLDDEADYPSFQNQAFDDDHAGVGGFTTVDVLRELDDILNSLTTPPQVILLGIGGNDLLDIGDLDQTVRNLNDIIDRLQAYDRNTTIIVEQIAPGLSDFMTPERQRIFESFNEQVLTSAQTQTTASSSVIAVDMAVEWSDAYMADEVHYNEVGAKVVADRYFQIIEATFFR